MDIGCFALIDPFSTMDHQLERIKGLGFSHADVTDNHSGGMLGTEFGFTASVSLDANPHDVRRMFERHGLTPTSFCAHANLLDAPAPWRYGTTEIIKAVRAAAAMGVRHVITTEGDPKTAYGHSLTPSERITVIRAALHEPIRVAADHGVTILLEPHGPVTGTIDGMESILASCGNPDNLAINADTGNIWLGGVDPVAYVRHFGRKIEHVHWKDLSAEMEGRRGSIFGSGMTLTALGAGVVDIAGVYRTLCDAGFDGHTTLEVAGDDAVLASRDYLLSLQGEPAAARPGGGGGI